MIKQIERRRGCMRIVANDTIDLLSNCECVALTVAVGPGHLIQETCVTILDGRPQLETELPQTFKAKSDQGNTRARPARRAR